MNINEAIIALREEAPADVVRQFAQSAGRVVARSGTKGLWRLVVVLMDGIKLWDGPRADEVRAALLAYRDRALTKLRDENKNLRKVLRQAEERRRKLKGGNDE